MNARPVGAGVAACARSKFDMSLCCQLNYAPIHYAALTTRQLTEGDSSMGISRRTWFVIALLFALGLPSLALDAQGQTVAEGQDLSAAGLVEQMKLTANDATAGAFFGWTVATSGDTALVGAPNESGKRGLCVRIHPNGEQLAASAKTDCQRQDCWGDLWGLGGHQRRPGSDRSNEQRRKPGPSIGWAYVFERSGGVWTQQAKLTRERWRFERRVRHVGRDQRRHPVHRSF